MFETLSHLALQQYWWVIISLLGSAFVFLLFVQGGQTLLFTIGKNDAERTLLVNALGRKWELTFTTLVTFGGAFFASFPLFYATSFSGAYWLWMIILFGFILQAVSYEYRKKPGNLFGEKTFELFLLINGLLGTLLPGAIVSSFFTGSCFFVNEYNLSEWKHPAAGLEVLLNIQNILLGASVLFLSRILALMYFINTIDNTTLYTRSIIHLKKNSIPFLALFISFLLHLLTQSGLEVKEHTNQIIQTDFKYLNNLIDMPVVLIMLLTGVILVIYGIYSTLYRNNRKGFHVTGSGTVLTVLSFFFIAGFNHTPYYPSTYDIQSSLTIRNSSSSHYTLTVMSYVSLFVPVVIFYIAYTWKTLNRKKLDEEEINQAHHTY